MISETNSHFSTLPDIGIQRSIIDRSHGHTTSFDAGELIPILWDHILPGDSVRMKISEVIRAQTMLTPVMGNMYAEITAWFVPMRLTWNHTKEFFGENTGGSWTPLTTYQIPSLLSPVGGFAPGTLADYMGIPPGVSFDATSANRPSALPLRAYAKICDEFWRDQNLQDPLLIPTGDSNQQGVNTGNQILDIVAGGKPFKVAKFHDFATSCLPDVQKGAAANIDFGDGLAPVYALKTNHAITPVDKAAGIRFSIQGSNTDSGWLYAKNGTGFKFSTFVPDNVHENDAIPAYPINLWADLGPSFANITVNELRLAFQLQKYLERNARGGTRYVEYLKSHFNVTSADSRLQRPEYLGGKRIPLSVHEVTNSAQSATDFLGDLGAKSVSSDVDDYFEHSFTEHGFLIICCCVRYEHSYSQALEKKWLLRDLYDFYDPVFANIGEVPVETCEVAAFDANVAQKSTFGYQEAWYFYRYATDRVSSLMRPGVSGTLSSWNFSDYYSQEPALSEDWIREDKSMIDRTLAVTSAVSNQFFADFFFDAKWTRPMPVYSIPGLIDHN